MSVSRFRLRFCFPFTENKRKLPFLLCLFSVCGIPETWKHGHGRGDISMETYCRDMEMETRRHRDMVHGHRDIKRKTEDQAMLRNMFTVCSLCKHKFVVSSFVNKQTLSVCKLTKRTKQT
jgi:hypothetical protein